LGGLDVRLLLKTDDNYCTITAIRKKETLYRPDWLGAKDTFLKWLLKIDAKSSLAVHIQTVRNSVSAYLNSAQFSLM
jgi:hypothetical protein